VARTAAVATAAATLAGAITATTAAAHAGWNTPVRYAQPQTVDVVPAQIAFSPAGAAAVAFGVHNEDDATSRSSAFVTERTAGGAIGDARKVPGALSVLALAFRGSELYLLTGSSPAGTSCCETVQLVTATGGGRLQRGRVLVRGLTGITDGSLEPLGNGGGLAAAIATERGVWVAQSNAAGTFGPTHRLRLPGAPQQLATSVLRDRAPAVAWPTSVGGSFVPPRRIVVATGTATKAPSKPHNRVELPAGDTVAELAAAAGAKAATLVWVQGSYDTLGAYHSVVMAEDLGGRARQLSPGNELAADISLAGDPAGDQVLAWDACDTAGTCSVRAVQRRAGERWGSSQQLHSIDASQGPAAAISSGGLGLVAWVSSGHVLASSHTRRGARFGRTRTVSTTNFASDLTLAFGPAKTALAAWTQGTFQPDVVGAAYGAS
jgi:hypothetical protein